MKKIILTFIATLLAGLGSVTAQNVAQIGDQGYATLTEAFAAANDGEVVTLLSDYDATSESMYDSYRNLGIDKAITFDGNGKTLTVKGRGIAVGAGASSNIDVTFKDITIQNSTNGARCIDTRGHIGTLTIENSTLKADGASGTTQPLTIGGNQSSVANVNITNSTIQTNADGTAYYAIITFNPVNMTISGSTLKGWACIYAKGPDGSAGSDGSTFTIKDNSVLTSKNIYNGTSNPFGMITVEDDNVTVNVKDATLNVISASDQKQAIVSYNSGSLTGDNVIINDDATVNLSGANATLAVNNTSDAKLTIEDGASLNASGLSEEAQAIIEQTAVAKIEGTTSTSYFVTLQAAIDAANEGDEITILKDFTLTTVTTNPSDKYNVEINKSVTINGDGHTITGSTGKRPLVLTGEGNEITIKNLNVVGNNSDWVVGIVNALTCNLDNTLIDGSQASGNYKQPLTIGSITEEGRVTLNVTNGSEIKTKDGGPHYAIIAWHPADITVDNSTLKGWANVYIKPDAAGSTVNISNSTMYSKGVAGGSGNSFGMITLEGGDNTLTLTNNNITSDNQGTNYNTLLLFTSSSTGNTVKVLGEGTSYTSNDTQYGGFTFNWTNLMEDKNNNVYFDAATKELFSPYFEDISGVAISEETVSVSDTQLYPLNYAPEVLYYWDVEGGGQQGGYYSFAEPFTEGWLADGEYIRLMKDITLTADIECLLEEGSFTLTLGDYTITKGDYSVKLIEGVSVITDKQTDIFSAADESLFITETANEDGTYTYIVGNDVYWSWTDEDGRKGYYDYFHAPFDSGNTTGSDEEVELMRNVTLTADIVCGRVGGTLCLKFGDYTVTANGHHVLLPAPASGARAMVPSGEGGVTIYTDKITDIFAAADEGYTILVAPSDNPDYAYAYQVVESGDGNAIARNKQTGILYTDLQLAVDQASAGNTIELLEGIEAVTIDETVNINKGLTIEGGDLEVTSDAKVAFKVTGPGSVTINKLNLNAQYFDPTGAENYQKSGSYGIRVDEQFGDSLVINYSTIKTTGRGIDVYDIGGGFVLDVKHSNIEAILQDDEVEAGYINSFDTDPDGRGRGINFSHNAMTCVANIQFSKIQGYAYPIHVNDNSGKIELNMTDCSTWGRDVINNLGDHSTFNLKNITANGYNNEESEDNESFAAIVDYKEADYNFYNIEDLRVVANVEAADADPTSASENFIDLRGTNATVKIVGNSGYEIADDMKDRVGFVNHNLNDTDVEVGETDAYKRMIDKSVNNKIYFDDQAKAYFNYWFEIMEPFEYDYDNDGEDEFIRIGIDDEKDHTNLYPVVPIEVKVMMTIARESEDPDVILDPKVLYYGNLNDAFNSEHFEATAQIQLLDDVDLDEDITVRLERGEDFTLLLVDREDNERTVNVSNDATIKLPPLVYAYCDEAQGEELFSSADETLEVIKGISAGIATYYVPANVYYADTKDEAEGDPDSDDYAENIDGGLLWIFKELISEDEDAMLSITPDCYVRLEADVKLDETYILPIGGDVNDEEVFYLDLNDKTISGYYKTLAMQLGTAVYTTGTVDIFSSLDPGYTVVYDVLDEPITTTYTSFEGEPTEVTFTHKYYLVKDGIAITVDPATYCSHRQAPTFIVKKKMTDDSGNETWVELVGCTKDEFDTNGSAYVDEDGNDKTYDFYWYLVPPADVENDDSTYIDAKTYVQALVIEGISFQGTRKADFIIKPRNMSDVTVTGNEQPWRASGYTADDIAELIAAEYDCIITEHDGDGVEMTYTLKKKGDDTLEEGEKPDYQVTVTMPDGVTKLTDVGEYKNIVKLTALEGAEGTKNFDGSILADFTILPEGLIDISKCLVTSKAVYNSLTQSPKYELIEVVYKNGYEKVVLDKEQFKIQVHGMQHDYVDAQTYSNAITLTGTMKEGTTNSLKFYGSVDADYVIAQRDIADSIYIDDEVEVVLEKHKDMEWTGEDLTNEIKIGDIAGENNLYLYMKVKDNGYRYPLTNVNNTGKYGFDYSYTVEPSPMVDPGEYKVIFTGRGNFRGMREIMINVLKDINLIADGIEVPLQVIPDNVSLAPSELQDIVVKDGDKVLELGVHYQIVVKDETGTTTYTEESPIIDDGMYQAIFEGLEPYYFNDNTQEMPVVFEYNHFDTSMDNTEYYNNYTSGYQIVKPVSIHVTSGKNMECQVGDKPGSTAVALSSITSTLPGEAEFLLGSENKSYTFKVVGIDDKAFNGCNNLHWVDALALEGYTPSTLTREASKDGPFSGYPVQSLVYLDGDDYTGTNYIYHTSDDEYLCEELKIYDDTQGDQQSVRVGTGGYTWEFMNKYEFTADKVTNTRYFTGGQHYTTCLPYKLQVPSEMKVYTLDAASDNIFGFKQLTLDELDQFTPYLLIPSKSGNLLNNAEKTVCYVTPTSNRGFMPLDASGNRQFLATPTGHIMYGSTIYMGSSSSYPTVEGLYIMQSKNLWKRIPAGKTYNNACVLPMRAYIMLPNHPQISGANPSRETSDGPEYIRAEFKDVDGVAEVDIDSSDDWNDAEVYDLQGRKVDTTVRLPKGVYIVNGQKRIRK